MRKRRGFTLVEIMIVVAIIALLAAIAIPNLLRARVNANDAAALAYLKTVSTSLETWAAANNGLYPIAANLGALALLDIATVAPVYIDAAKLATPQFGHNIAFAGSASGYQVAANTTTNSVTGTRDYMITTGGVEVQQDCTVADFVPAAP